MPPGSPYTRIMNPDDFNDDDYEELAGDPRLAAIRRFVQLIGHTGWFRFIGEPLDPLFIEEAREYLDALGFGHADVALIEDWDEAAAATETNDWNSSWWEAEEQLVAHLTEVATQRLGEDTLETILTIVTSEAGEAASRALEVTAEIWNVEDEELLRAAAGAVVQACYQAALVLAAGADVEHPFSLKFHLFESGHWPLAVTGNSFNIF
jgi:hypothetical protein